MVNGKPVAVDFQDEHLVLLAASLRTGLNQVEISFVAGNQSLNRNDDFLYTLFGLALLEEIQQTGNIFFPYSWLQATLGSYQTPTFARTVREFLAAHPQYNPKLRAKLLQAADDLFRAEKLVM